MCFVWPKIYCKINHIWLKSLDIFHITFTKENICGTEEEVFFSNHIQNVTHHSQKLHENLYRVYLSVECMLYSWIDSPVGCWTLTNSILVYYNLVCLSESFCLSVICYMTYLDYVGLVLGRSTLGRNFYQHPPIPSCIHCSLRFVE